MRFFFNCLLWNMFHLFVSHVIETHCAGIAVIHDALQQTSDIDFWLTTIFNNVKNISCPTLFDFKMFPVKSEVFVNVSSFPKGDSEFKGFIFFTTRCQMSDDMELNINHGVPSLRVDFVPCPPPAIPGLIERLPFHHLNASFFHLLLRLSVFYPVLFFNT